MLLIDVTTGMSTIERKDDLASGLGVGGGYPPTSFSLFDCIHCNFLVLPIFFLCFMSDSACRVSSAQE